jgi:hypothetical protein
MNVGTRPGTDQRSGRSTSVDRAASLPNFLVIGAMKTGTDSLWQYLRHHPDVFMSELKEPDFFIAERNWGRGIDWYRRLFRDAGGAAAIGEASTGYSKFPRYGGVPARIARFLPQARLVYVVRHPVERIQSQYVHNVLVEKERRPISKAVLEDRSYVDFSSYTMQIQRFLEHFPRDALLVITSEGLRADREATVARVLTLIRVEPSLPPGVRGQEFHRTAEKRVARSGFELLKKVPGYSAVSRLVPAGAKRATSELRTRGIDPAVFVLPDAVRTELGDRLRDDVGRLRTYLDPGFDGWGLA